MTWQPEASMPPLCVAERVRARTPGRGRRGEVRDKEGGEWRDENGGRRKDGRYEGEGVGGWMKNDKGYRKRDNEVKRNETKDRP